MNKKKISKILSSTLSVVYLTNYTPVFAQDIVTNESNANINNVDNIKPELEQKDDEPLNSINDVEISEDTHLKDDNLGDSDTFNDNDGEEDFVDENVSEESVINLDDNVSSNFLIEENNSNVSSENIENVSSEETLEEVNLLSDTINFKDENLQKAINKALSRAETTPITISEIGLIKELNLSSSNITDLSGIEYAISLTNLNISSNNINSLQPLADLTELVYLEVSNNKGNITVDEVNSVIKLPKLSQIIVSINDINNDFIINGEDNCPSLQSLIIQGSILNNVNIINNDNLQVINMSNCVVQDVYLENLTKIAAIIFQNIDCNDMYIDNVFASYLNGGDGRYNNIFITNFNNNITLDLKQINANRVSVNGLNKISYISMEKSNIDILDIHDVVSNNPIFLGGATIDDVSIVDSSVYSFINMEKGTYKNVLIENISNVDYLYLGSAIINNLNLKNIENLKNIYSEGLITSILDLSEISSLINLYSTKSNIDKIIIKDIPNLESIYITETETVSLSLLNLPKLNYIESTKLKKCDNLIIDGCNAINNMYLDESEIGNLVVRNSFYNGYISSRSSKIENFNCESSNIEYLNLSYSSGKSIDFFNMESNIFFMSEWINFDSVSFNNVLAESIYLGNSILTSIKFEDCKLSNCFGFNNGVAESIECINSSIKTLNFDTTKAGYVYINDAVDLNSIVLSNGVFDTLCIENALNIYGASLTNISVKNLVLSGFNELSALNLNSAGVETMSLSGFESLEIIDISNNKLVDINCLGTITSLNNIMASNNKIQSIEFVKYLSNLVSIDFRNNNINDVEQLKYITTLKWAKLDNNKIKDISPLANCINLQPENLSALNQIVELPNVYSKSGVVTINHPTIIDIDGTKLSVSSASNNGTIGSDFIEWKYDGDGILTEQIEASSVNNNFTVIANQEIIIDNIVPELNVSVDTTEFTNKDVVVTITASDELSGLEGIYLPDGSIVRMDNTRASEKEITFNINKNGEYKFIAKDKAGNITEKTVVVNNVDKEKPVVSITKVKELSNKKQTVMNITASDNLSGIKSVTLPDGTVISDTYKAYTFTENGSYEVVVEDFAGNIATEIIDIKGLTNAVENDNESNVVDSEHSNMPSTGGLAGILSIASVLSATLGAFIINKRKK